MTGLQPGTSKIVRGVLILPLAVHADRRGLLVAPSAQPLPFEVRNFFYIHGVPAQASRGNHSSSSDEAMIVVQGCLEVDLDNGDEQASFELRPSSGVLCVHAGIHLRLHRFGPETILLVLASRPYIQGSRRDHPQPELLGLGWQKP